MELNLNKFKSVKECYQESEERRRTITPNKLCEYPIKCLNDFLTCVLPSELVIIAADTGTGKSEFANKMAIINATKGKRVYLVSLEGDKQEVLDRWKWEIICKEYYKNPSGKKFNYSLFVTNQISEIDNLLLHAEAEIIKVDNCLKIFDRSFDFTVDTLTQQMELIKNDADLIIIDHLHYFSLFDDQTEATQISKIMKTIKKLTEEYKIPVILVSHLRKKEKDRGLADNEDLMGSSNIAKVASTVITINPQYDEVKKNYCETIIRVTKNRAGMRPNVGFSVYFDMREKKYEEGYDLVKINSINKFAKIKKEDVPQWAKDLMEKDTIHPTKQDLPKNYQDTEEIEIIPEVKPPETDQIDWSE